MRHVAFVVLLAASLAACVADLKRDVEAFDRETDRIDDGIGTITEPPSCEDLDTAAYLCGGDPRGIWLVREGCLIDDAYDPLDGTCDDYDATASGTASGTVEIGTLAGFSLELEPQRIDADFAFDLACYGGATSPCDGAVFGGNCMLDGEICRCETRQTEDAIVENGFWQRFDGSLSVFRSDSVVVYEYCRLGPDLMTLVRPAVDDDVAWSLVLERIGEVE